MSGHKSYLSSSVPVRTFALKGQWKMRCTICAMTVTDFCLILMALFMLINQLLMLSYKPVNHSFLVRQFFYPPLLWHLAICFIHKKTNLIDCIATFEKELNNICVCRWLTNYAFGLFENEKPFSIYRWYLVNIFTFCRGHIIKKWYHNLVHTHSQGFFFCVHNCFE